MRDLDDFTRGFLECLLWSECDQSTESGGEPFDANYTLDDIDDSAIQLAEADCAKFQKEAAGTLDAFYTIWPQSPDGDSAESFAGHNFALTRNGHGTGSWDRDAGRVGDMLTEYCKEYGEFNLYLGDDGRIYAYIG